MWPMRKKWRLYLIIKHCSKSDLSDISQCNQHFKAHHCHTTSFLFCMYSCSSHCLRTLPLGAINKIVIINVNVMTYCTHICIECWLWWFFFRHSTRHTSYVPLYSSQSVFHHRFTLQFHPLIAQLLLNHPSNSDCHTTHTHNYFCSCCCCNCCHMCDNKVDYVVSNMSQAIAPKLASSSHFPLSLSISLSLSLFLFV